MTFRLPEPPSRVARFALRAAYLGLGIATAFTLSGCPDGAELENPDRFLQYNNTAGTGVGGAVGGAGGSAGMGQTGGMATGGAGTGSGGVAGSTAGTGTGIGGQLCDVQIALTKSCARTGCHSAGDHYADLDLSNPAGIAAQMYNMPAKHGDINCAAVGMPFRECTEAELPATCPQGALLIDPTTFENSWVYKKLNMDETCGDAMPIAPGNSVTNGWDAAGLRKDCLLNFFRTLPPP